MTPAQVKVARQYRVRHLPSQSHRETLCLQRDVPGVERGLLNVCRLDGRTFHPSQSPNSKSFPSTRSLYSLG